MPEYNRKDIRERIHVKYKLRIVYWLRWDIVMILAVYHTSNPLPERLI